MCLCGIVFLFFLLNCSRNVFSVCGVKLDTVFVKQRVTERNEPKMCRTKYPTIQEQIIFIHIVGAIRVSLFLNFPPAEP